MDLRRAAFPRGLLKISLRFTPDIWVSLRITEYSMGYKARLSNKRRFELTKLWIIVKFFPQKKLNVPGKPVKTICHPGEWAGFPLDNVLIGYPDPIAF
jgi:hypothetical protein